MNFNSNEIAASKLLRMSDQLEYLVPIHRSLILGSEATALDLDQLAELVVNYPYSYMNSDDVIATAVAIRAVAVISPSQTRDWMMLLARECDRMCFCKEPWQLTKLTVGLVMAQLDTVSEVEEADVSSRADVLVPYARCWHEVMEPILCGTAMMEHGVPALAGELLAGKHLQQHLHQALKRWFGGMLKWDEDFLIHFGRLLAETKAACEEYPLNSFHYWLVKRLAFAYWDQLALSELIRLLCPA